MIRSRLNRIAAPALLMTILIAAPAAGGGGAPDLELVPSSATVALGDPVDIDVVISNLGNFASPGLRTFDLSVTFDPAIFSYDATSVGVLLGDSMAAVPEATVTVTPGAGDVRVLEVSFLATSDLLALQPASFTLFTVTFTAAGLGDGAFDLVRNASLGDELADPLPDGAVRGAVVRAITPGTLEDIPTLSQWGLALLLLALATAGVARLRRAQR